MLLQVLLWWVVILSKNGAIIEIEGASQGVYTYPLTLNIIATDEIFITLNASASRGDLGGSGNVDTKIEVNKALLISGSGAVTGLPIVKTVSVTL
jgi:hypothetical protein